MRNLTILFVILTLTACSSGHNIQLKYYDFAYQQEDGVTTSKLTKTKYLHINRVNIQGVADQQPLIQILRGNSVNIANYHFWSQHPKYTLTDSMTRGLVKKISAYTVIPAGKTTPQDGEFMLQVKVTKLAGHYELGSLIEGQWFIYQTNADGKKLLDSELFSFSTPLKDSGFDALIKAHQSSWEKLTDKLSVIILSKSI
ncbi:membrane integrity-associated transporter subunit PqiC [Pseudoalteromonas sp. MTN2-4]|uniref:PqiC family protein n=1 Tax=Pseudoalteromonas sp. MTN2-4 TaxID=3056555 RepID=UPI0036F40B93